MLLNTIAKTPNRCAGQPYITLEAYEADLDDEISFPKDVIVEAIHKHLDGWWIIRCEWSNIFWYCFFAVITAANICGVV